MLVLDSLLEIFVLFQCFEEFFIQVNKRSGRLETSATNSGEVMVLSTELVRSL